LADLRINLYDNLSTLIDAGVPIGRALKTVQKRGRIGKVFRQIEEEVARATSLAEAVEARQHYFDPLDVALIRVGEDSGQIAEVFQMLGEWYSFRQRLNRTIRSGLVLPFVMINALALLAPVPGFALGGWDVGAYIRNIISILALFYIPGLIILGILYLTPQRGLLRGVLDAFVLRIPVLGAAVRDMALSRYCKIFGITLKAGLPIFRASELAVDAAKNAVIRRAVQGGADAVKRGDAMSTGFSRRRLPADFIAVWEVGEETGDLDESALRLGRIYGENAERGFQSTAAWVPRIVYFIVMLVMVYFILKGYGQIYGKLGGGL
jgi:type II secretory pathway component PulF